MSSAAQHLVRADPLRQAAQLERQTPLPHEKLAMAGQLRYFHLRPEVESAFACTHAVGVGADIGISGAVSMDDRGNPTVFDDLEQQMENACSDLSRDPEHYGGAFDDVTACPSR